jgi:hypothetical protein
VVACLSECPRVCIHTWQQITIALAGHEAANSYLINMAGPSKLYTGYDHPTAQGHSLRHCGYIQTGCQSYKTKLIRSRNWLTVEVVQVWQQP